jgi:hypothetical protein
VQYAKSVLKEEVITNEACKKMTPAALIKPPIFSPDWHIPSIIIGMRAKRVAPFPQRIKGILVLFGFLLLGWFLIWAMMIRMPANSFTGSLPPLTAEEEAGRARLQRHIAILAGEGGEHHFLNPARLEAAARYIESAFRQAGYEVRTEEYRHDDQPALSLSSDTLLS